MIHQVSLLQGILGPRPSYRQAVTRTAGDNEKKKEDWFHTEWLREAQGASYSQTEEINAVKELELSGTKQ